MNKRNGNKGQGLMEYAIILALVSMVAMGGIMALGENSRNTYADLPGVSEEGTAVPTPMPAEITVQVRTEKGENLMDLIVIGFNAQEEEIGSVVTDASGLATFSELDPGPYVFRATYAGQGYWSETVITPQDTQTTILISERQVQVYVVDSHGRTLQNVPVFAFNEDKDYGGQKEKTDKNGSVSFILPDGDYKFRADYQAQETWSETINTQENSSVQIRVPIAEFTVRVTRRNGQSVANIPVYAFNANGGYTGIKTRSNQNGTAVLEIPDGNYKFRADYGGDEYWSNSVTSPDANSISLYVGGYDVTVRVTDTNGNTIANQMVYLYNGDGEYLKRGKSTDKNGSVTFELNEGSYRFRALKEGGEFWSSTINVPNTKNATIRIERDSFLVTVTDKKDISGQRIAVYVYRYRRSGRNTYYDYTGLAKYIDLNGQAAFDLSDGDYIFLAYNFTRGRYEWSNKVKVPSKNSVTIRIRK